MPTAKELQEFNRQIYKVIYSLETWWQKTGFCSLEYKFHPYKNKDNKLVCGVRVLFKISVDRYRIEPDPLDETLEEKKIRRQKESNQKDRIRSLKQELDLRSEREDDEEDGFGVWWVLDTPNNKEWIEGRLKSQYPSAKIYRWKSRGLNYNRIPFGTFALEEAEVDIDLKDIWKKVKNDRRTSRSSR